MDAFRSAPPHSGVTPPPEPAQVALPAGAPVLSQDSLRANLADFALAELVRQHRGSFQPLWTRESWAKLLIWLALNSGCSGDTASLEAFAASLGPERSGRLRHLFFSREDESHGLRLVADPAEGRVLVHIAAPEAGLEPIAALLAAVGLADRVVADRQRWQHRDGGVVIPWR